MLKLVLNHILIVTRNYFRYDDVCSGEYTIEFLRLEFFSDRPWTVSNPEETVSPGIGKPYFAREHKWTRKNPMNPDEQLRN